MRQTIRLGVGGFLALQAVTIATVVGTRAYRKRRDQSQGFPHSDLPDTLVGENRLHVYSYGRDLYDAMLAAIDRAEESIYLETFIWKDDAVGREFKERLARKARQGVGVYVIFDSFANLVVPRRFKQFPREIHALGYQAIRRPWHLLDPRHYALDHRKLLVVDGRIGFIGGYNIGRLYATEWRDTHLSVEGPFAAGLAQVFANFWNAYPAARPRDRIAHHYPREFDPRVLDRVNNALHLTFPIRDMYISAIDRAEQRVLLTNAYFIPDRVMRRSLIAAVQRGVEVTVLLPWVSNHTLADWLARGHFTPLLRAGVRIFGYRAMIHAKTCTIDGQWTTIGTANIDRLSQVGNYEVNVEIYSHELAEEMERIFALDKSNAAELDLARWEARPWRAKLGERILAPLRVLL